MIVKSEKLFHNSTQSLFISPESKHGLTKMISTFCQYLYSIFIVTNSLHLYYTFLAACFCDLLHLSFTRTSLFAFYLRKSVLLSALSLSNFCFSFLVRRIFLYLLYVYIIKTLTIFVVVYCC